MSDPLYGDATSLPDNLSDCLNLFNKIQYNFSMLPVNIKELFNNNPHQFALDLKSGNAMSKLDSLKRSKNESVSLNGTSDSVDKKEV